jgi:sec-independent protein translocase protein TatB
MLDFGFSEIVLTSAIALIVLGPEKLPKVARQVGNWMGRARAMARQLTDQLEREVNAEDLLKQTRKHTGAVHTGAAQASDVQTSVSSAPAPFDTAYTPPAAPALEHGRSPADRAPPVSSAPHGADWHPSPPENKPSDG